MLKVLRPVSLCLLLNVVAFKAYALDLGALHTHSAQGQPLNASVAITDLKNVKLSDLKVKLASNHDLGISGIKGLDAFGDVSVELVAESHEKVMAVVKTSQPIQQSYVSFLLEVRWPSGRLMREYTGLLKKGAATAAVVPATKSTPLPKERQQLEKVVTQSIPQPSAQTSISSVSTQGVTRAPVTQVDNKAFASQHSSPVAQSIPANASSSEARLSAPMPKPVEPVLPPMTVVEPASKVVVKPKQTLWDIAVNANLTGKYTNQQVALAIFRNNRHAFKNGDINQLKNNETLQLPSDQQIEVNDPHTALVTLRNNIAPDQPPEGEWVTAKTVTVKPKETLWDIAVRHRATPYVNTRQLMLAIVRKNPHAFTHQNVNGMQKGAVLTMPNQHEILAVSAEDASQEVRRQIAVWSGQAPVLATPKKAKKEGMLTPQPQTYVSTTDTNERKSVKVKPKQTAWSLAVNHLPGEDVKVGDMIRALIRLNPHAFPNADMNALEVGQFIQIPTRNDLDAGS